MLKHRKFTTLLLAALLLIVGYPMTRGAGPAGGVRLLYSVLVVLVFAAAIFALFRHFASRAVGLALGAASAAAVLTNAGGQSAAPLTSSVVFHVVPAAFLLLVLVALLRALSEETDVSADAVNGAFCGYLLIGLLFAHLYCLVEAVWPGSFAVAEALGQLPPEGQRRHYLFVYYSLMTLTTVGYGDVTPRSDQARAVALLEAMIGQFYIAVVLSQLVALRVSRALVDREAKRERGKVGRLRASPTREGEAPAEPPATRPDR